jgi:eukaryotic-like serine/threonine-protein kinase
MDLYSLGIMFYELLTGQHPFERSMESGLSMSTIILARRDFAPRLRTLNPKISPGIESIVLKLLNPDAENRYQTATELLTDLTLHQENRPLKFTRNPSIVERLRKYRRRHPVQAVLLVAVMLAMTTFGATGAAIQQSRQRTAAESTLLAGRLHEAVPGLRIDLTTMEHRAVRAEALAKVEVWFERYDVTANSKWLDQESVRRLTDADRERLTHEIGELALLCGHAERLNAFTSVHGEKSVAYERALRWNRIAQNCYESGWLPLAVSEQRVQLSAELNRIELADEINPTHCTAKGPLEFYLHGLNLLTGGRYASAADAFETLVDQDPAHAGGQFALATSYQYAGRYTDAAERFQLAKALSPLDPRPALYRGLLLSFLKKHVEASKEFTVAIQRDPRNSLAYYYRAITESHCGNLPAAIADATKALELGEPNYRTLMLRASFSDAKGDTEAAARDRGAAGKLVLHDEADLTARGNAKLRQDPEGALKDYVKATEVNPRYLPAWQNQAHVLGEIFDKPNQAINCLDRALELNPGYAPGIIGRAVVHARLGKTDEARKGAELAIKQSGDSFVLYQVACVYAILSKSCPEEAKAALDHLRIALRKKYSDFDTIAKDSDLDAIRKLEEFKLIVDSAKEMKAK